MIAVEAGMISPYILAAGLALNISPAGALVAFMPWMTDRPKCSGKCWASSQSISGYGVYHPLVRIGTQQPSNFGKTFQPWLKKRRHV